jgi:hypothetical protein
MHPHAPSCTPPLQHIEVSKLVKARPLDNMEFMQWFKGYYDQATGGRGVCDYEGAARRALCKTGDLKGGGSGGASAGGRGAGAGAAQHGGGGYAGRLPPSGAAAHAPAAAAAAPAAPAHKRAATAAKMASAGSGGLRASGGSVGGGRSGRASDDGAVEQLQAEVAKWRLAADTATKEKDFYVSAGGSVGGLCS